MAAEGTGATSSIRIKSQTALDTLPTSAMRIVPFASVTPDVSVGNQAKSKHLGPSAAVSAIYNSPLKYTVDYNCELGYTTLDDVLGGILGTPTTSGDGAATAYANVFAPAASPLYRYLQIIEGDIPTGKCVALKNALASEVTIAFSAADPLGTVSAKYACQPLAAADVGYGGPTTGDTIVSSGAVTLAHVPILNSHWTIWNVGVASDTTYCVKSCTIKLTRPVQTDRACLGSLIYKAPIYTGPVEVSIDLEVEFESSAIYAAIAAQTVLTGFRMKAVGPTTGIGSDFYTLEVKSLKSLESKWALPIEDNGKLVQKYTIDGYGTSGTGQTYEAINFKTTDNINGALI